MDITSEIRLQVTGFCLAYSSLLSDTLRWGCCPLWGGSHDKELREASGQQLWGAESCNNLKVNLEADHPPVKLWLDRTASLLTPEPGLVRDPEPEDPAKPCLDSWCRSCERMCLLFWATKYVAIGDNFLSSSKNKQTYYAFSGRHTPKQWNSVPQTFSHFSPKNNCCLFKNFVVCRNFWFYSFTRAFLLYSDQI